MTHTAKHTPGPCIVGPGRIISTPSGEFYLTYGENKAGEPLFKSFVELDHNAHFIAAAPAMYEALKFLTSEIDLSKLNVRKDFSLMNAHAWAIKVILQAEGKLL
jgi:hypothetical protein